MKRKTVTGNDVFAMQAELLTFIQTHATSWTVNFSGIDTYTPLPRRGTKMQISKGGVYFTFCSTNYRYPISISNNSEITATPNYTIYPTLSMQMSRGSDSTKPFYNQPDAASYTGLNFSNFICFDESQTTTTHFLISDDENTFVIINQFGQFTDFMIFGNKFGSALPSGQLSGSGGFYIACNGSVSFGDNTLTVSPSIADYGYNFAYFTNTNSPTYSANPFYSKTYTEGSTYKNRASACFFATKDGSVQTFSNTDVVSEAISCALSTEETFLEHDRTRDLACRYFVNVNNYNSILMPIQMLNWERRGLTTDETIKHFSQIDDIYYINATPFNFMEKFTISATDYLAVPCVKHRDVSLGYTDRTSKGMGIAIKITQELP